MVVIQRLNKIKLKTTALNVVSHGFHSDSSHIVVLYSYHSDRPHNVHCVVSMVTAPILLFCTVTIVTVPNSCTLGGPVPIASMYLC